MFHFGREITVLLKPRVQLDLLTCKVKVGGMQLDAANDQQ